MTEGPLSPFVRGFRTAKKGEAMAACRDAWDCSHDGPGPVGAAPLLLAVADGASTASSSGLWALLLAQDAVTDPAPRDQIADWLGILPELRGRWREAAQATLTRPLSWCAEAALERGAFSTLLRVRVEGPVWTAEGWGDSCLFHLRAGRPLGAVPDLAPEAFALDPFLLSSSAGHDRDLAGSRVTGAGSLEPGDILMLATDALACWLVTTGAWAETVAAAAALYPPEAFGAWVDGLRESRGLKNDDTTLVIAEFL